MTAHTYVGYENLRHLAHAQNVYALPVCVWGGRYDCWETAIGLAPVLWHSCDDI